MKSKDFVFYGISILALSLFMFSPIAANYVSGEGLPGLQICSELLQSVDHYVSSRY